MESQKRRLHSTRETARKVEDERSRGTVGTGWEVSAGGSGGRQMPRGGKTGIIRTLVEQDNDYVCQQRGRTAPCLFNPFFIQRCFSTSQTRGTMWDKQCALKGSGVAE